MVAMIILLIKQEMNRQLFLIFCFVILSHLLRQKCKILWLHLVKCVDYLVCLALCDCKLNVFGLLIANQDKTRCLPLHLGLWKRVTDIL